MRPVVAAAATWLALQVSPAQAEIYRFLDANGREQFTTHLEDVPPAQRDASAARAGGTLNFGGGENSKPVTQQSGSVFPRVVAPASGEPSREATPATAGGYDEMWWRSTAQSHADRVARMEAGVEACERADERRRDDSGLTPLGACDAAEAKLESAEDALDQFEEKARRDEVPTSWLR